MQTVTLIKPYSFEGQEYTELNLDFDALTGRDIIDATLEARSLEVGDNFVPELSKTYLAVVAAKAAKVPVEMVIGLPAKDFTNVTVITQNFLLG